MKTERSLKPHEQAEGRRFLDSLEIGEIISNGFVGGGEGGFWPSGTPEFMIKLENVITFKRNDFVQRFSSVSQLEATIRWGCPFQKFEIRRTGEREYEMLNNHHVGPRRRSPRERFESGDWHGY